MNGGNNLWYIPTSISMLQDGDIDLSEYDPYTSQFQSGEIWLNDMKQDVRLDHSDNQLRNYFPIGTSLLCLPGVWIYNVFNPIAETENPLVVSLNLSKVFASVFAALSVYFLILTLQNLSCSVSISYMLGSIFAFASPHFSIHAGSLWSHSTSVFLILVSLWIVAFKDGRFSY